MSEMSRKGAIEVGIQRRYDLDAETAAALNLQLLSIHMTGAEDLIRQYQEFSDGDPLQWHPEAYPAMVNALEVGMVAAAKAALAVLQDPQTTNPSEPKDECTLPWDEAMRLVLHVDRLISGSAPIECVRYFSELSDEDRKDVERWAHAARQRL
jgi:hypothetical protein